MYQHTENLRGVHGKELEIRCNAVAAAVLLPASAVLAMPEIAEVNGTKEWTLEELSSVARPYHVSREAMARRLVTLGKLSSAHYQSIRVTLIERKKKATSSEGGGPPHFETLLRNLGPTYVRAVLTARQRGLISESRLGDYIFGRVQHAPSMAEKLGVDL
jgi:Zn-dependent peptidase ImmA (M78 family)